MDRANADENNMMDNNNSPSELTRMSIAVLKMQ